MKHNPNIFEVDNRIKAGAFLTELFEFEYCGECGGDVQDHEVGPDPFGLMHAFCLRHSTDQ